MFKFREIKTKEKFYNNSEVKKPEEYEKIKPEEMNLEETRNFWRSVFMNESEN